MKRTFQLCAAAVILAGILFLLQELVTPKYVSGIVEGSLIEEYYREEGRHDVIFLGDCEVYESFSPITLWEKYGITSYIRGSAQQLIWQSYYLLEETLKYEKPRIVVFNVLAMQYDEPQSEAYNRLTLDGMKMSWTKLKAIKASMLEDEKLLDYIFPLLRYHSRWSELTREDFQYIFRKQKLFHNGYYMRVDVRPVTSIPAAKKLPNYEFGERAYYYLDRMVELCQKNDIALVLVKAPSLYPHWHAEWEEQIEAYAQKHNLLYVNYLEMTAEIGIDYSTDTYDAGLHMNLSGAEKISRHFGQFLMENFPLTDHRGNEELSKLWQEKAAFYYEMRDKQYQELQEYGYLKSFGANQDE